MPRGGTEGSWQAVSGAEASGEMSDPRCADDGAQREDAVAVESVFPGWLVMWGPYTRRFWGYPRFSVPPGTIAQAADPSTLAGTIRKIQRSAGYRQ